MNEGEEGENVPDSAENPENLSSLEQWKFYGRTAQDVSNRRLKNNRFYLRLLIALLGVAGIGTKLGFVDPVGILLIGAVGLPFSILWAFHILSYKQLNSGKYRVLWNIAEDLPYDPFQMEWERLEQGNEPDVYIKHTTVEVWWPRVFGYFFAVLFVYGGLAVLNSLDYFWYVLAVLTILWGIYAMMVIRGQPPSQRYWEYTGK